MTRSLAVQPSLHVTADPRFLQHLSGKDTGLICRARPLFAGHLFAVSHFALSNARRRRVDECYAAVYLMKGGSVASRISLTEAPSTPANHTRTPSGVQRFSRGRRE